MPSLTVSIAIFVGLGAFFLFIHLLIGKVIRPIEPDPEKLTIYECGEPTIGSAWVQFDLRYYVVALLFVIFDVEVAFFFPWAIVFGKANTLAQTSLPVEERLAVTEQFAVTALPPVSDVEKKAFTKLRSEGISTDAGRRFGIVALIDILVFFGVLLVGFAYLWKRGDINWVRSIEGEKEEERGPPTEAQESKEPAMAGV